MSSRELPPRREYQDTPDWEANDDNVRVRGLETAWNLLLEKDFSAITFRDIAKEVGVSPNLLYHHLTSLDVLAEHLAIHSLQKLSNEIVRLHERANAPRALHTARIFLTFAKRRPHHFTLMLSPRFNDSKAVMAFRDDMSKAFITLLERFIQRKPRSDEVLTFQLLLYGGGARIAAGEATVNEVLGLITRSLTAWRKAQRKKA